jgi:hypothetical protein
MHLSIHQGATLLRTRNEKVATVRTERGGGGDKDTERDKSTPWLTSGRSPNPQRLAAKPRERHTSTLRAKLCGFHPSQVRLPKPGFVGG